MQPKAWALLEFVPKKHWNFAKQAWEWRANLFRKRSVPDAPILHDVAWAIPGYQRPNGSIKLSTIPLRSKP